MYSDQLDRLRRNIAIRLGLWYSLIFTASTVVLFAMTYYLLAEAIQNREREVLDGRLKEAARVFDRGGVSALRNWVQDQSPKLQKILFVRLVNDVDNVTLLNVPEEWVTFNDKPDWENYRQCVGIIIRVPEDEDHDFALETALLKDRSLLQLGRSTNNRQALLRLLLHSSCQLSSLGFAFTPTMLWWFQSCLV